MRKGLGLVCAAAAFAGSVAPASAASQFLVLPGPGQVAPSIASTDPTQTGALGFATPAPGTCAAETAEPPADAQPRHFDRYPLANQTDQAQCVTVSLDPLSCTESPNQVQSAAYIPAFTPAAIAGPAFRSDIGQPGTTRSYSFTVPPGSPFEVVVNALAPTPSGLCAAYALTMSSAKPWAKTRPAITGAPVTGETLSAAGEWGTPAPVIARRWQRCDATGANCVNVPGTTTGSYPGATPGNYLLTDADVGHSIRAVETATDAANATLSSTSVGLPTAPVQSGRPRPAYSRTTSTGAVQHGGTLVPGSQGVDDATVDFALPFPVTFYGTEYTRARLSTNGNVQFASNNRVERNGALPTTQFGPAILPHWDDLVTTAGGEGIFTSVSGSAPDRVLHIEWRADLFDPARSIMDQVNFEVRLRESAPVISLIYGNVTNNGSSATVGVQAASLAPFTDTFPYSTPAGLQIDYTGSRPSIAGTPREGVALEATDAAWVGPGTITTALQWLACDAGGGACAEIGGATGATFTPGGEQVGRRLRVRATATNGRGSTAVVSAATEPVAAGPSPPPGPDKTLPVIKSLKLTNHTFAVARGVTPIAAATKPRRKRGTNIRSSLSEAGAARYTIQRELSGRRVGKRCVKSTRKLRKRKRCKRYRALHTLTRKVVQGNNRFFFTGRLGSIALAPNRYRVVMRVTDAAGNTSSNRSARFRIVAR